MSGKQYSIQRIMVPSLGEVPVRYDFQPDQVTVVSETPVVNPMDVYPDGASGGSSLPLYAMGPLVFPGVSFPQSLLIKNNDVSIRTIRVIAQKGYLPTQIVPPTTLIVPESAYPQSQTRYENAIVNQGSPINFLHNHVGSDVVVYISIGQNSAVGDINITGVNIGGVPAIPLGTAHIFANFLACACGWFIRTGVAEGPVQISTVCSAPTADAFYGQAFSYNPGIRTGNISLQSYYGLAPPLFSVIGQELGSVVLCALHGMGGGLTFTEESGAPEFDPMHVLGACHVGAWRRTGIGTQSFDFAIAGGNGWVAAAALELLPRI